jgi:hypothetical protein
MALVEYEQTGDALEVTARWAGDSRCYVLTPGQGLHQISEDDTEVRDILDLLIDDQPMVNLVSASTEFAVNTRCIAAVALPCVVLCATDGFFGYVATPALFEHVLLGELRQSRDLGDWAHRLTARVRDYTADDASLCLAAFGFGTFHLLRDRFDRRFRELHRDHAAPLAAVDSREGLVAARRRSWEAYRGQYLRYLEPFGTGAVDVEGSGRR